MKSGFKVCFFVFAVLFISFTTDSVMGQSYGMVFASNEVVQDERTGIDLSPGGTLCFEKSFDLSFELSFIPNKEEYFGYIFRLIDNKNRNIDLVYDNNPSKNKHFTFITKERSTDFAFDIDRESLFERWSEINLRFNLKDRTLTYNHGSKKYTQKIDTDPNSCFKILFGSNKYGEFKTTDVPPMKIRNIQIREQGDLKYSWPLNESEGNIAVEEIGENNAEVSHPLWIKKMHYKWQLLSMFSTSGPASVAFDSKNEQIQIIGLDSLFVFDVADMQTEGIKYKSGTLNLQRGNQSYFNTNESKLYNIFIDQKTVSSFDYSTQFWNRNFTSPFPITDNWQFNKLYSPTDSSLYIFGGYGHFLYKNEIKRYHIPTNSWQVVNALGDMFIPRYLAALGPVKSGAFILGGYGSPSGQQILNPKNLYDLLYFDIKTKSFKKIYELTAPSEDFVFANSLVVNEKERTFYGLVFPKHKFNSTLQLIKGSLDFPSFEIVGDTIPYQFHDINSYSDLYYCPQSEKFIAVTLFLNSKNQTEVSIYSLLNPPLASGNTGFLAKSNLLQKILLFSLIAAVVMGGLIYVVGRRKKGYKARLVSKANDPVIIQSRVVEEKKTDIPSQEETVVFAETSINHQTIDEKVEQVKNQIFLFGDLQLFDTEGNDITKYFTPLIKELFLGILLYTIRWERGISSEKLKELLWFDKTAESARNNRSVNIAKLKTILEKMKSCQVSKETGYWKINIDYTHLHIDYHSYLSIINDKRMLNKQKIKELADIIQRGSFLSNLDYEWLDSYKSEVSNEIIDTYLHFANSIQVSEDPEFLIKIASYIFYFDTVNEEAMMLKCKALVYLGKHSLARTTFENFNKEYKAIYGKEFGKDFHEILE